MHILHFLYPLNYGWALLPILAILESAIMNIHLSVFVFLDEYLEAELLEHMVVLSLSLSFFLFLLRNLHTIYQYTPHQP